jgi:hypothetical protein
MLGDKTPVLGQMSIVLFASSSSSSSSSSSLLASLQPIIAQKVATKYQKEAFEKSKWPQITSSYLCSSTLGYFRLDVEKGAFP